MVLILKNIINNQHDLDKIDQLYQRAFPDNERAPLEMLVTRAREGKGEFLGIYDEQCWVGFVYLITYQRLTYILYLAIDERYRHHGYGSALLQKIQKCYTHTVMLCIEEVAPHYDNYQQRIKRKQFYLKNGFQEMNFYFYEYKVRYEMLYYGPYLESRYFDELMYFFAGEEYKEIREDDDLA